MKIDINYTVSGSGKKKPTSAFDCAQLAKSICDELLGVPEIWAVEENLGNDFYNLRRNSRRKRNVPCDVFGSYKWVGVGDAAFVVYEDMRKSRPKIIGFSGRLEHDDSISTGIWIQAEGNFFLSRCGLVNSAIPSTSSQFLEFGSFSTSNYGLQRMLGCVYTGEVYIIAYYIGNGSLDAYSSMRVHAFKLTDSLRAPMWNLDIQLSPEISPTDARVFLAGLFYDADKMIVTVADKKVWSVQLNQDHSVIPSIYKQTDIDARYCFSVAGKYGLLPTTDGCFVYKRGTDLSWNKIGNEVLFSHEMAFDIGSSSRCISRPFVFFSDSKKWVQLANPSSKTPTIVKINTAGTKDEISVSISYQSPISLTDPLLAGDDWHEANDSPGPSGFPYIDNVLIHEYVNHVWGGRYSGISAGPGGSVFIHPRPGTISPIPLISSVSSLKITSDSSVATYFAKCSDNSLVYACSEPVSLVAPTDSVYSEITSVVDTPFSPPGYTDPLGNFISSGVSGTYRVTTNTHYHKPVYDFCHKTMIRRIKDGSVIGQASVSSGPFDSIVYESSPITDTAVSESLECPEVVYGFKVGSGVVGFVDCVFVLHDYRGDIAEYPRPALTSVSASVEKLHTLINLAPTDVLMTGEFEWNVTDARIVLNLSDSAKFAIVGIYSENPGLDQRKDIYIIDVSDMSAMSVSYHLTETNGSDYPRAVDFDRIVFGDGIFYLGEQASSAPWWMEF